MKVNVLTLFPEMFPGFLGYSLAGRAMEKGLWTLNVTNIRDFAEDVHKTVDDVPFGGGAGMVMKVDVLDRALASVYKDGPLYYMSPRGKTLTQKKVVELAEVPEMTIICGRFEGIDERIFDLYPIEEMSIGDFVLSGGEPAALTMLDAILRYLPSVMGNRESLSEESFSNGLLEYPQYTRPQEYRGQTVPDVLLSGHHQNVMNWRRAQSEMLTEQRRPDLWKVYQESEKKEGLK